MPEQSDYGTSADDTALVPGTLTAYRHFAFLEDNRLYSMNGYGSFDDRKMTHVAECHAVVFYPFADGPVKNPNRHRSPDLKCRCGFYAHYAPDTDFYWGKNWGLGVQVEVGAYIYTPPDGMDVSIDEGWWSGPACTTKPRLLPGGSGLMLRSVVELSGKVIMGRLGVRAEKMSIKALSVDWGKFSAPNPRPRRESYRITGSGDHPWWDPQNGTYLRGRDVAPAFRNAVDRVVAGAAARYGARFYTDPADMYAAHPQPDLSALGLAPAKPPEPMRIFASGGIVGPTAAQQLDEMRKKLQGLIDAPTPTPTNPIWDAALEAKKNRPAPPGSGIDRRRGRLR
jgi:hypothetical protein